MQGFGRRTRKPDEHSQMEKTWGNLEHFSTECWKTETKVITTANQKNGKYLLRANENSEWKQPHCPKRGKARATKPWLIERVSQFSEPITERSKAKPMQILDYFRYSIDVSYIWKQDHWTITFYFHREVIRARTKWFKRYKLYKDDLYRKLKRLVSVMLFCCVCILIHTDV